MAAAAVVGVVLPAALRFLADRDRGALKQSLLRATLRGTPRAELAAFSREFVRDTIGGGCFREALATFRRHRDAGHYLVLMSASVDFYVPEFGRQLGFDQVISTEVRWEGERLEGTLTSANRARRGEGALPARAARPAREDADTFAYGNSESDLPHLQTGAARHARQRQPGRPSRGSRTGRRLRRMGLRPSSQPSVTPITDYER